MIVLGLDIETTGLDHDTEHVTEIAWVVKEHGDPKPLDMQSHFILPPEHLWNSPDYIKPNIQQLTKIRMAHVMAGKPFEDVFRWLADAAAGVDCIVAHYGCDFDKPFLEAKSKHLSPAHQINVFDQLWVDTASDVAYPEDCRGSNLMYIAAYHGMLNPFAHAALFDVMTMLKVLDKYPIELVTERAKSPWCFVSADIGYANRQLAKDRRYGWETAGGKTFAKTWVKKIKEMDLAKEKAEAPFAVHRLEA